MQCIVCKESTDNPKFCSNACKQKDWRRRHPYLVVSTTKKTLDELVSEFSYVLREEVQEIEGKSVPEILKYLYGDERQVLYNGKEFILV